MHPYLLCVNSNILFIQLIAVQLLGTIGGEQSVVPLQQALSSDRWVVVRIQSLTSLTNTSDAKAIPLIVGMSKDGNSLVGERAESTLLDHYRIKSEVLH